MIGVAVHIIMNVIMLIFIIQVDHDGPRDPYSHNLPLRPHLVRRGNLLITTGDEKKHYANFTEDAL